MRGRGHGDVDVDLMELAVTDPESAIAQADRMLSEATGQDRAEILRGRGVAHRRMGDLPASHTDLQKGLALVEPAESPNLWASCALSLGGTLMLQGETDAALSLMAVARDRASGKVEAEASVQFATAQAHLGDMAAADDAYCEALPQVRSLGMRAVEGQLLANRALVRHYQGRLDLALVDSAAADELYRDGEEWTNAAQNMANRAMTLFRLGHIPASLEASLEAEELIARTSVSPATFARAKCETLMAAGLFAEALDTARSAADFHRASDDRLDQIEAMTLGAEAAMAQGDTALAARLASATVAVKGAQAFTGMRARADLVSLRSSDRETWTLGDVEKAVALAEEMRRNGRPLNAVEATVEAARIAVGLGDHEQAHHLLGRAARPVRRAPLSVQAQFWALVAALREEQGNDRGALAAIDAGLRRVEALYASVGSFEMRARAGIHARAIERVAARVLGRSGRTSRLSEIVTRRRAAALSGPGGARAAHVERLAGELDVLRAAESVHRVEDTAASRRAVTLAQRRVSDRSRVNRASDASDLIGAAGSAELASDESQLVFYEAEGQLFRIDLDVNGSSIALCAPMEVIEERRREQAFLARQLARRGRLSHAAVSQLEAQYDEVSSVLSRLLLPEELRQRVLISVPSDLHTLAWASLPELWERPHCLTPSLEVARRVFRGGSSAKLVAGASELLYAEREVDAVGAVHDCLSVVDPAFSDVVAAGGADLWHLAGHFVARGDNPMFSAVHLGGVDLHAHHVLGSGLAPRLAVLSGCTTASGANGGAQIGFAHALLASGTTTVVATSSLLEDGAATLDAMTQLHAKIARGVSAADALAQLRVNPAASSRSTLGGLTVFGAGWPAPA